MEIRPILKESSSSGANDEEVYSIFKNFEKLNDFDFLIKLWRIDLTFEKLIFMDFEIVSIWYSLR